jgi:glutaminyl-tRNA synthetase
MVGVTRAENLIEWGVLEHCVRQDCDAACPRTMVVLRPVELVITGLPEDVVRCPTALYCIALY